MNPDSKIYVAGHGGMLGSVMLRRLQAEGYGNLVTCTHAELDLCNQTAVGRFFSEEKPEYVFLIAARVGGIADNKEHPFDALYQNTMIEMNVIKSAFDAGIKKLVFVGSACVYPELSPQPMKEGALLTGAFEFFLRGYALAKTVGIKLCEYLGQQYGARFTALVPPNIYGAGDKGSTVLPMLMKKFADAVRNGSETVEIWGTGNARREFLHADDLCGAMLFAMDNCAGGEYLNVGHGTDISIRELAEIIRRVSGFSGGLSFDPNKPEGVAQKLLDCSKFHALGWKPRISLEDGIRAVYAEFINKD
jgi:GDP-L-fucose synthase